MKIHNKRLYFLVIFCCIWFQQYTVNAQTPGGTSLEIELWLQADKVQPTLPADGDEVILWQDLSPKGINFERNGSDLVPRIKYSAMNYHPSLQFYMDGETATGEERKQKLIAASNMTISNDKSYYTFWVSVLDPEPSYTSATVFNYGGSSGDNDGWRNETSQKNIWMENKDGGSEHHSNGLEKIYGIGTSIRPNNYNSSYPVRLYHNGAINTASVSRGRLSAGSNKPIIGNGNTSDNNYFFGEILEIIVLSAPVGTYIDDDDLNRVHSYLSIKYGLTLEGQDVILSDGTIIWDGTGATNTGYTKNVFGIGRDDASGLNQKQAQSYGSASMTVFLNDLQNLNSENTANITDGHFLMFGSNDLNDLMRYPHPNGAQFENGVIEEEINARQQEVFKAQTTGASAYTVNIKSHIGGHYVLVSAYPDFPQEHTRIYKIEDGEANNVLINNGEYISFATYAIAPGGVIRGLRMWLNASNNVTTDNDGNAIEWVDQHAGKTYSYMKSASYNKAPGYGCDPQMNFHPGVKFREEGEFLSSRDGVMIEESPNDYTFFSVINNNFGSYSRSYFMGFGSIRPGGSISRKPAFGVHRETLGGITGGVGRLYEAGGAGSNTGNKILFVPGSTTISYHQIARKTPTRDQAFILYEFDGYDNKINDSNVGNGSKLNGPNMVGVGSEKDRNMIGVMGEIFAYERELTQTEKNHIYSYLGLKYGITLDLDKSSTMVNFNYELSDKSIVWDGDSEVNRGYHNNVAALVKDDYMHLHNMQSHSTGVGQIIHMGIGERLGCNPILTGFPDDVDKVAIAWGHDNTPIDQETDFFGNQNICGEMDKKIDRIWLVEKTGIDKQEVILTPDGDAFPYKGTGFQLFLLVADSPDKINSLNWDRVVPGELINGNHIFRYTFTEEHTYFSFGIKAVPGACQECDFDGIKKLNFKNWTKGGTSNTYDLGDNFVATVEASIASPGQFRSRYPRASSQGSLREYRKGDVRPVMKTVISFNDKNTNDKLSATAKFDIFEIDYRSGKYDNVKVYGMCDAGTVPAKLSYHLPANRSSYRIVGNTAMANRRPTSSYTSARGKMSVSFEYPVQQVIIEHTATGRTTGNKRIGIGSMEFRCPPPMPTTNEDGLAIDKQSPEAVEDCENVIYTFRIRNDNCAAKPVDFLDELEDGMIWATDGLRILDAIRDNAEINDYEGSRTLDIKGLIVPGSTTLEFNVVAKFEEGLGAKFGLSNGQTKIFKNKAVINYKILKESLEVAAPPLYTNEVQTTVTINDDKPKRVSVKGFTISNSCYKEERVYSVNITIDNPNSYDITDTTLEVGFNEEFNYQTNSVTSTNNLLTGATTDTSEDGSLLFENISIRPGESTITFKVKAPSTAGLIQDIDENGNLVVDDKGNPVWVALGVSFDFYKETSSGVCEDNMLVDANGYKEIPYCLTKGCVISNINTTPTLIK